MKILVTVGTTNFDRLIKAIDNIALYRKDLEFIFQIADGKYNPLNGFSFEFSKNIYEYYHSSDLVISHAGAGSIYSLLEIQKKTIIVPNLDRKDNHQIDIAKFIEQNKFAIVNWNLSSIEDQIDQSLTFNFNHFKKDPFFRYQDISNLINTL
ncbi:PssE/Cps14G family polysaccharide biosynthesis glycosyltransferase [Providencia rettgeri]|uniref:PssE/Cps14G family polysaccharide biosynthesis glycosyltransferase n=1 Tax=Providencia rettgeri TaxID=587 RepID=UPI0005B32A27|nr:PssE/Cps14G family polysaccharide biosynthesis glycosyltransferase [Providencia rettgeri]